MLRFQSLIFAGLLAVPALAKSTINLYWGQNGQADRLAGTCALEGVDYVTITFVHESPENAMGYPGTEFGAHCPGETYPVNGVPSHLLSGCTAIAEDIAKCHKMGKKVLLSIGGVFDPSTANYGLSTVKKGEEFADFMWGAFGPYSASWTGPRPFDLGDKLRNTVDGFDFDIEKKFPDQTPWIAMINRLREHYAAAGTPSLGGRASAKFGPRGSPNNTEPRFLITGAPQCPLADEWFQMKDMISKSVFDILFLQFYNNEGCDAVNGGFNYDEWTQFLKNTKSADATLFIGLPASIGSGYIEHSKVAGLVDEYGTRPNFGGIMLWDSYWALDNKDGRTGKNYYQTVKEALATVTTNPTWTPTQTSTAPTSTSTGCGKKYIVMPGDYCYKIASDNGISVEELIAFNPELDSQCNLRPGQALCLSLPTTCTQTYVVVPGDYCYKIATSFGIEIPELKNLNPWLNQDCELRPGDNLCVKGPGATSTTTFAGPTSTPTTTFMGTGTGGVPTLNSTSGHWNSSIVTKTF